MAIQHSLIADADRHEAKGASTATSGQVLKSNGDGTTSFVNPSTLQNLTVSSTLEGLSVSSQGPSTADTPYQVTWGSSIANSDADIASNGVITLLTDGLYFITIDLAIGRTGTTGVATIISRVLVNDVPTGIVHSTKIDTSANVNQVNFSLLRKFNANDTIKVQIARDSGGNNDGGLITVSPTTLDWGNSPSAAVRIQKIAGGY